MVNCRLGIHSQVKLYACFSFENWNGIVISDANFLLMILNICAQKKVGKLEMFLRTQNLATFLVD